MAKGNLLSLSHQLSFMSECFLHFDSSTNNRDLLYLSGFTAPDPFIYLKVDGMESLFVSRMEHGRAEEESKIADVRVFPAIGRSDSKFDYYKKVMMQVLTEARSSDLEVRVTPSFPSFLYQELKDENYNVEIDYSTIQDMRVIKSSEEVSCIEDVQRKAELALREVVKSLEGSREKGEYLVRDDELVTSEGLRFILESGLLKQGCHALETIVSCGSLSANPHYRGEGPIRVGQPIVIDLFPRSESTMYYADITRTFVVGKPDTELVDMYETVREAQEAAFRTLSAGVSGYEVHNEVCDHFEGKGYKTLRSGAEEGFIHGTGHGLGLEIHERPYLAPGGEILARQNVVTVEPGLYYKDVGGVRIEDLVVITKKGYKNLTGFEKRLEVEL